LVENATTQHVDPRQWEIEQAVEAEERQGAARASTAMVSDDPVPGLCPGVLQRDRRRVGARRSFHGVRDWARPSVLLSAPSGAGDE
jgi:hypothetical protein